MIRERNSKKGATAGFYPLPRPVLGNRGSLNFHPSCAPVLKGTGVEALV
jgi:hypothetical protein